MRHRVDHRKLGRTHAHRKAMLANMVTSLFDKERITTTDAKAKEARRSAERLITRAKKGYAAYQEHLQLKEKGQDAESKQLQAVALSHWRQASRVVRKRSVLKKLFDVIAPQFLERNGGYTRILTLGHRPGDNAKTVMLELVGTDITRKPMRKGKAAEGDEGKKEEKAAKPKKAKAKAKAEGEAAEAKPKAKPKKAKAKAKSKAKGKATKKAPSKGDA